MANKKKMLTCRAAEGMVSGYINHTLSVEDLESFLEHIKICSSCYDELETYFIVHEVTKQLDDDEKEEDLDFKMLLEYDIKKSRQYIKKEKAHHILAAAAVSLLIVALAVFLVFVATELL